MFRSILTATAKPMLLAGIGQTASGKSGKARTVLI
jgi:hypothetical protein